MVQVLFMNPFLLSLSVENVISERKARLEALLPGEKIITFVWLIDPS